MRDLKKMIALSVVIGALFWQCEELCEPYGKVPEIYPQSFSIKENSPNESIVGGVEARPGNTESRLIYSIIAGSDGGTFLIDSLRGNILVGDSARLDYETRARYELAVQVKHTTPDQLTSTAPITITVLDIDETPALPEVVIPTDNLIAFYPLNGNAGDSSGSDHHGTLRGSTFSADRYDSTNYAASFDGQQTQIDLPLAFDYPSRTINLWFNARTIDSSIGVIYESDQAGLNYSQTEIGVIERAGQKQLNFLVGDPATNSYGQPIEEGKWYMMTVTVSQETIKYYLNAELVRTLPYNNNVHSNNGNFFATLGVSRSNQYHFDGSVDQVRIYDRSLSNEEIAILYQE